MKNIALVISTVLFTVGCGQSVEAQRADAAKCASYIVTYGSVGLLNAFGNQTSAFTAMNQKIDQRMLAKYPSMSSQVAAIAQGGPQYAAMLEPARSTSLQQAGAELAQQHIAAEDDKAIVAQLSACIDTWEKLSKR